MNILEYKPYKINEEPTSATFTEPFLRLALGVGPHKKLHEYQMFFDEIIAQYIVRTRDKKILLVEAGLEGDWGINHQLYYNGIEFFPYMMWTNSNWAQPSIYIKYEDGTTEMYATWSKTDMSC